MRGQDLYKLLFDSLDLPETFKTAYLNDVMKKYSITNDELTVEILREIVADFLQDTILNDLASEPSLRPYVQNQ